MAHKDEVLQEIEEKYTRPVVDYFGAGEWRVTVPEFHIHHGVAMYGTFCAYGVSAEAAGRNLLEQAKTFSVVEGETCDESCPQYTPSI